MRDWRNWLLPLLTGLIVFVLALLPLKLSTLQDNSLTGTVHSEELTADSGFPAKPPDLAGRIWLLAQSEELEDNLSCISYLLEEDLELLEARSLMDFEIKGLQLAKVLPSNLSSFPDSFTAVRTSLRNQTDLSSTQFLFVFAHDAVGGCTLSMQLDLEAGRTVSLRLYSPALPKYLSSAQELGQTFLDRLGLTYELLEETDGDIILRLPEQPYLRYSVYLSWDVLTIHPGVDWAALEEAASSESDAFDK